MRVGNRGALMLMGALLLCAGLAAGWRQLQERHAAAIAAQRQLNASTQVQLASAQLDRDQLRAQLAAARTLHGKLVAALALKVPARDTLVVHDTLYTTRDATGTRTATFRDSTFAGILHGTVTAPPDPAPLGITYTVDRPAFTPSVGFVRTGNAYYAVVEWQGEQVQIQAAYADPEPPKQRILPYLSAGWSPAQAVRLGVGTAVRLGDHWFPHVEVGGQFLDGRPRPLVWMGLTYVF